ncbi:MAG: GntR family transcriptional regulator [Desulfobacteraceae bacterium]|nr:MAG: GntR family transcriptional regulator [Desulfobacteraceae bacterium]
MLNPDSPVPLYHQLAQILTERIREKEILPGEALPSETALAGHYGIGRPTVRQAIEVLVKKGLVERKRGSGTYVKEPGDQVDLFSLAGTSSAFETRGIQVETRLIESASLITVSLDPDNPFAEKQAYFLSRITRTETVPVLIEEIYMDPDLFQGIDHFDLEGRSLAQVVADAFYLVPVDGRQTFRIQLTSEKEARLLGLEPQTPVLEVKRELNFSKKSKAVFSRLLCRTDTFVFAQHISANL